MLGRSRTCRQALVELHRLFDEPAVDDDDDQLIGVSRNDQAMMASTQRA